MQRESSHYCLAKGHHLSGALHTRRSRYKNSSSHPWLCKKWTRESTDKNNRHRCTGAYSCQRPVNRSPGTLGGTWNRQALHLYQSQCSFHSVWPQKSKSTAGIPLVHRMQHHLLFCRQMEKRKHGAHEPSIHKQLMLSLQWWTNRTPCQSPWCLQLKGLPSWCMIDWMNWVTSTKPDKNCLPDVTICWRISHRHLQLLNSTQSKVSTRVVMSGDSTWSEILLCPVQTSGCGRKKKADHSNLALWTRLPQAQESCMLRTYTLCLQTVHHSPMHSWWWLPPGLSGGFSEKEQLCFTSKIFPQIMNTAASKQFFLSIYCILFVSKYHASKWIPSLSCSVTYIRL